MDDNPTMTTDEGFAFDTGVTPEAAPVVETPVAEPQYATKEDFQAFANTIAETIKGAIPQPTAPTPVNTEDVYAQLAEQFYDNPAQAFAKVAELAAKKAQEETISQLAGPLGEMYRDYNSRSVTGGVTGAEAEYLQSLASENLINAETMQNPKLRDVVMRAAKQYAQEKSGVRAPQAEGAVGGSPQFTGDPEFQRNKQAFERAFGMKYEDAMKEVKR